jgi:hypothetical protein
VPPKSLLHQLIERPAEVAAVATSQDTGVDVDGRAGVLVSDLMLLTAHPDSLLVDGLDALVERVLVEGLFSSVAEQRPGVVVVGPEIGYPGMA